MCSKCCRGLKARDGLDGERKVSRLNLSYEGTKPTIHTSVLRPQPVRNPRTRARRLASRRRLPISRRARASKSKGSAGGSLVACLDLVGRSLEVHRRVATARRRGVGPPGSAAPRARGRAIGRGRDAARAHGEVSDRPARRSCSRSVDAAAARCPTLLRRDIRAHRQRLTNAGALLTRTKPPRVRSGLGIATPAVPESEALMGRPERPLVDRLAHAQLSTARPAGCAERGAAEDLARGTWCSQGERISVRATR